MTVSNPSALMGHPPISHTDLLIRRALVIIAPSQLNPNKSEPFGPPRPANYSFQSHASSLIAGEAVCIFFILLFTISRLITRWSRTKEFGMDDWLIIPGALGAVAYLSLDMVASSKGCLGKHMYDCTYAQIYWFERISRVQEPLFYFAAFCVKLSIAFANRRFTGISSKRWATVHWIFIGLFVILLPTLVFLQAFQCIPVSINYSLISLGSMKDPRTIKCLDSRALSLACRIIHILTDVALLCVPIIIVARLQIARLKKARITLIFLLGGMSTIASILRNRLISHYLNDVTWQYYEIFVWNMIDLSFAVIVASLPGLNFLLDVGIEKIKSYASTHGSRPAGSGSDHSQRKKWSGGQSSNENLVNRVHVRKETMVESIEM